MNDKTHRLSLVRSLASLLLVAALATAVSAAPDPVMRRGFSPDAVYSWGETDSVDLFSGNLTQTIPLGQKYSSNGSLSYQFLLTYNSNFWDFYEQRTVEFVAQYKMHNETYMSLNDWGADEPAGTEGSEALPGRLFNAGLGWRVSLGDIIGGPINSNALVVRYVDEHGTERAFFTELHVANPSTGLDEVLTDRNRPAYTRDGTYLRLRRTDAPGASVIKVEVDFPNGITKRFSCIDCSTAGVIAQWNLDEIRDPFGNTLTVTRTSDAAGYSEKRPPAGSTWTWTYTERNEAGEVVRTHVAEFLVARAWRPDGVNIDVAWELRLKSLKLAACCDGSATADFNFTITDSDIFRPPQSNWLLSNRYMMIPYDNNASSPAYGSIVLGLLRGVSMPPIRRPDGTSVSGGGWAFRYLEQPSEVHLVNRTNLYPASDYSGRLERVAYPTGGGMRYEYESRNFIKTACIPLYGSPRSRYQKLMGVSRRQPITSSGNDDGRPWIYAGRKYFPVSGDCIDATDFTATVIDPLGKATVSYFSITVQDLGEWRASEYGLPASKFEPDLDAQGVPTGRYLASEVYDCSTAGPWDLPSGDHDYNPLTPSPLYAAIRDITPRYRRNATSCIGPLRSTYTRYETSGVVCDPANALGDCSHANRRLVSSKTVFKDFCTADPRYSRSSSAFCNQAPSADQRYQLVEYSDYDGLGHYRTTKTSGDFYARAFPNESQAAVLDSRRTVTWYNSGVDYSTSTQTITGRDLSSTAAPWVLDTYSLTKSTQGSSTGATSYTHYSFDPNTGFLIGMRKLAQFGGNDAPSAMGTMSSSDTLLRQSRAQLLDTKFGKRVTVVDHRYYGGDAQNDLAAGSLTAPEPTSTFRPEYWIRDTYLAGAQARKVYLPRDGNTACPVVIVEENQVDTRSGLVTSAADEWGLQNDTAAQFDYDALGRFITIHPPGEVATEISYPDLLLPGATSSVGLKRESATSGKTEQSYQFDSRGRLITKKRTVKGNWSRIDVDYDNRGLVSRESNENGGSGRSYSNYEYDIFGRRLVSSPPPPENDRRVFNTYYGDHRVETMTHGVASGGWNVRSKSLTSRHRDALGRLIKVDEPIGATTTYGYDMNDNLRSVSGGGQTRTFTYDGRGFKTSENPPELASYQIKYASLDSRGNVRSRLYRNSSGAATRFDLKFEVDEAERVTAVIQPDAPGQRILKTFTYDRGRIVAATRTNWVPPPVSNRTDEQTYAVTDTFDYYPNGKLYTKTTSAGFEAKLTMAWDDLGNLKSLQYPQVGSYCPGVCATIGPSRAVSYGYSFGALNTVTAGAQPLVNQIDYFANGLWKSVSRGNATTDYQTIESDYARPSSLRTAAIGPAGGTTNAWTSGTIEYDGLGNIFKIGSDTFRYDLVGRLTDARVGNAAATGSQTFTYDRFGNMTTMATDGVVTTFAINSATNRMSSLSSAAGGSTAPVYDLAGNLKTWTDPRRPGYAMTLDFDPFNMATHAFLKGPDARREFGRVYLYDATDERVAVVDYALKETNPPSLRETWSLRGPGNEVLRDIVHEQRTVNGAKSWNWRHSRDYVYRGTSLLAEIVAPAPSAPSGTPETTRHMHLDHLGTVRAITDASGRIVEQRKYLPFGEQLVSTIPSSRMAYAGHERDDDQSTSPYGDLDYMHARYYSSALGRFLSADPEGKSADPKSPGTWNRYAYVNNNPLSMADLDGKCPACPIPSYNDSRNQQAPKAAAPPGTLSVGAGGSLTALISAGASSAVNVDRTGEVSFSGTVFLGDGTGAGGSAGLQVTVSDGRGVGDLGEGFFVMGASGAAGGSVGGEFAAGVGADGEKVRAFTLNVGAGYKLELHGGYSYTWQIKWSELVDKVATTFNGMERALTSAACANGCTP